MRPRTSSAEVARSSPAPAPRSTPLATVALALACPLMAGCGPADPEPYRAVADVQELMLHVVEPSAQVYWGAVGWILDGEGEHYVRPTDEEAWLAVENAAFTVAESGNLMMMPDRAPDDGAWVAMAQALVEVGERALRAAEARDEQGVFDLGAEMYAVCSNCHARYSPEVLRPSDERSVPPDER